MGATLMLLTLSIAPVDAQYAIDFRVISFLFGILVISAGFEKSGLIEFIALWIIRRVKRPNTLLLAILFGSGLLSAVLATTLSRCLAGNLTWLGAVSNVMIVGETENWNQVAFSFFEFFKAGWVVRE